MRGSKAVLGQGDANETLLDDEPRLQSASVRLKEQVGSKECSTKRHYKVSEVCCATARVFCLQGNHTDALTEVDPVLLVLNTLTNSGSDAYHCVTV